MADVVEFPVRKRPPKAIVVTQLDTEWFSVVILPHSPGDAARYGPLGDGGLDFGDYRSAVVCAFDSFEEFGRAAGLVLVDGVQTDGVRS